MKLSKSLPATQEQNADRGHYDCAMEKKTLAIIQANIERLMHVRGLASKSALARAAGYSLKTSSNLLNPEVKSVTLDTLEMTAKALGVSVWQLALPDLTDDPIPNQSLRRGMDEFTYRLAAAVTGAPAAAQHEIAAFAAYTLAKHNGGDVRIRLLEPPRR